MLEGKANPIWVIKNRDEEVQGEEKGEATLSKYYGPIKNGERRRGGIGKIGGTTNWPIIVALLTSPKEGMGSSSGRT